MEKLLAALEAGGQFQTIFILTGKKSETGKKC